MKIEKQVVSLENAKKLKELGIKQDSIFYHVVCRSIGKDPLPNEIWLIAHMSQINGMSKEFLSAFTASELLEILNAHVSISKNYNENVINVYYSPENGTDNSYNFTGDNLADLLAKVIIAQHSEGGFKFVTGT